MKKFVLAAVAVIVATTSLASVAEARRHDDDDWGRHHNDGDWGGRRHRDDDWGRPGRRHMDVIVYRPDCSMTKIVKETDWGTKVIFVKRCD